MKIFITNYDTNLKVNEQMSISNDSNNLTVEFKIADESVSNTEDMRFIQVIRDDVQTVIIPSNREDNAIRFTNLVAASNKLNDISGLYFDWVTITDDNLKVLRNTYYIRDISKIDGVMTCSGDGELYANSEGDEDFLDFDIFYGVGVNAARLINKDMFDVVLNQI